MHGLDVATWRTAPPPRAGRRRDRRADAGRHPRRGRPRWTAPTASAPSRWPGSRWTATGCWEVDDGLFWIVAAVVRMLADDDLGDFWSRARAAGPSARLAVRASCRPASGQGFWHRRRGELDDALACVAAALDQIRMWGGDAVSGSPTSAPSRSAATSTAAISRAARRAADAALAGPRVGDGGRLLHLDIARLLVAEERHAEALACARRDAERRSRSPTPSATPGGASRRRHCTGSAAPPEAVDLVAEEVAAAAALGSADLPRRGPAPAGRAARRATASTGSARRSAC